MRILTIFTGEYGIRHLENIKKHGPDHWEILSWQAPKILPPVIDYPEDYLPKEFPHADLILSFAEIKGVAELLPDIAEMTGARSCLVAVDNEAWLPKGLDRQLHSWLRKIGVSCVTPKPLCSLTENDYGISRRERKNYNDPLIAEFAEYFGKPSLEITVDPDSRKILAVDVQRDAVCGCARYVAQELVGLNVDDAEEKAGLLHHHYPCLASMAKLPDFNHDTLMHESGNLLKESVSAEVKPFKRIQYIEPGKRSE
jgi:hypothetical protein